MFLRLKKQHIITIIQIRQLIQMIQLWLCVQFSSFFECGRRPARSFIKCRCLVVSDLNLVKEGAPVWNASRGKYHDFLLILYGASIAFGLFLGFWAFGELFVYGCHQGWRLSCAEKLASSLMISGYVMALFLATKFDTSWRQWLHVDRDKFW